MLDLYRSSGPECGDRRKQAADRAADHGAALRGGRPDRPAAGDEPVAGEGDDEVLAVPDGLGLCGDLEEVVADLGDARKERFLVIGDLEGVLLL